MKQENIKKKFAYKWVIVALCFFMVFIVLGFCSSNKSLYLTAITKALNIKRSVFSLSDSIRFIATAIINVFFGTLVKKFGTKKLICTGLLFLILSLLLRSIAENVWVFYLDHMLMGIGFSWTSTTMVGCVINRWCKENKGTIMGLVLASNGLGGALAAQIVTPIIYNPQNAFGYRTAYRIVAVILAVMLLVFLVLFKDNPQGETKEVTVSKKKSRGRNWVGLTFNQILKTPYFYGAAVCIFITGFTLQGFSGIMAPHFTDVGINTALMATIISAHSLALTFFKFAVGFVYDKFGLRTTVLACNAAAIFTCFGLAAVTSKTTLLAFAVGIFSSLAMPLETIMLPIYTGDLFGQRSYDHILGLFVSINVSGYAVGIPIFNFSYDVFGSYTPALIFGGIIMTITSIALMFIISAAHKKRKEVEECQN